MGEQNNAICAICGTSYRACNSCLEQKSFQPWRTVVDSIEHYKIYLAIHGYTISKDKIKAKQELNHCNLLGLERFNPEIKSVINEIMSEDKKSNSTPKSKKANSKTISEIELAKKENIDE